MIFYKNFYNAKSIATTRKIILIGIDLFAGAGGMSLGARQAGVEIKLCVENDPHALATYSHNHKDARIFSDDIRKLSSDDILSVRKHYNDELVVFGGPPCQGFSTSNQRTRSSDNPNNWLFQEFIRVVKISQPDWVVFENVKGILETEGGIFLEHTITSLQELGYTVSHQVLNAAEFGVPQARSRLFVVGNLHGVSYRFPKPIKHKVTVSESISDLPKLSNGAYIDWAYYASEPNSAYARKMRNNRKISPNHLVTRNAAHIIERYKHIPQGGNWEHIPKELMSNYADVSRCHTGIYRRLKADEPSVVIGNYRKNMLIHPWEHRSLSVREAARLQSFPDWFEFKGSIGFQQQQVGNAVPPLLAKAVFQAIK
ncbi:MAG: DNA cytosine methyltransferase [Geobacteraceae bacterium]|nr:DNA cytosine methyltransferase [Geobacteraceae bacterium]